MGESLVRDECLLNTVLIIQSNICGDLIRLGRATHKPPLTQKELANKVQSFGVEMSKTMISRIERGKRHVTDAELKVIAQALGVFME